MDGENPFRIAVLAIFVVTVAIGVYHRWQAAQSREKLARREEGLFVLIALRLAGFALWFAAVVYLISPPAMAWASLPLPPWLRCAGLIPGVAATALMYWTLSNLGKNLTDTVVTRAEHTLVQSGPYRWVRHPFYVTAALLIVSVSLLAANWAIALAGTAVIALLVIRTPNEERHLLARFGSQYQAYMDRTGRFLPRLW